jgi:hypothetical protein
MVTPPLADRSAARLAAKAAIFIIPPIIPIPPPAALPPPLDDDAASPLGTPGAAATVRVLLLFNFRPYLVHHRDNETNGYVCHVYNIELNDNTARIWSSKPPDIPAPAGAAALASPPAAGFFALARKPPPPPLKLGTSPGGGGGISIGGASNGGAYSCKDKNEIQGKRYMHMDMDMDMKNKKQVAK